MSEFKTDEEQAEDIKAWWKENGTSVIAGIALAIAALFGWDYWKKAQVETAETAAGLFEQSQATTDLTQAAQHTQELQTKFASTPYAALASLESAKGYAEAGEYEPAVTALRWVVDNSKETDLKEVAAVRLARVLAVMGKHEEAMQLASKDYGPAYESLLEEVKGDIYVAQNKPAEARKAYERAILTNKSGSNDLIKMKLDNLGKGA